MDAGYALWEDSGTWMCLDGFDTLREAQDARDKEVKKGTPVSKLLILTAGQVPGKVADHYDQLLEQHLDECV